MTSEAPAQPARPGTDADVPPEDERPTPLVDVPDSVDRAPRRDDRRSDDSDRVAGDPAPPTVPGRASVTLDGRPFPIRPHHCFACGATNVHGLGLPLHVEGDSCWTELTLPDRFEGWEGIAHGGIVCTILDEVMAWSLAHRDAWGVTARMTVDFRRPVPVGVLLRGEGRLVRARRRLLDTEARLIDADSGEVLATAQALYVTAPDDRKAELKRRYGFDAMPVARPDR